MFATRSTLDIVPAAKVNRLGIVAGDEYVQIDKKADEYADESFHASPLFDRYLKLDFELADGNNVFRGVAIYSFLLILLTSLAASQ